jgi:hypothetical protein
MKWIQSMVVCDDKDLWCSVWKSGQGGGGGRYGYGDGDGGEVFLPRVESVHRTIPILTLFLGEEDGEGKFGAPKRNWYTRQTEFSHVYKTTNGTLVNWGINFKSKKY